MDGTGLLFRDFAASLPDWVQPVVVSYSSTRCQPLAELAQQVVDAVDLSRPAVVLAESYSSLVLLEYLRVTDAPPAAVVVVCGFTASPRPVLTRLAARLLGGGLLAWGARTPLARWALLGSSDGAPCKLFDEALGQVLPSVLAHRLGHLADATTPQRTFDVPCLYLEANGDWLVPHGGIRGVRSLFPEVTVASIEGPHLLLQAAPTECRAALVDFLVKRGLGAG